MPKIDANIDEGTVGEWLKSVGESFAAGEPLVEIITDKATFELQAETAGILRRVVATEKSTVPVGYILALASDAPDEPIPDVAPENERILRAFNEKSGLKTTADAKAVRPADSKPARDAGSPARIRATPAARRLAREMNLNLADVPNEDNRMLTEKDVLHFAARKGEGSSQ